jgi:anti-sigma factor RsiW
MALSETDLELLETYLDGELADAEANALRDRLRTEPLLAGALQAFRDERQMRAAMWAGLEPSDRSVATLMARVEKKVDDHWMWASRLYKLKMVTAAAACILVGFIVGRVGKTTEQMGPGAVQIVTTSNSNDNRAPVTTVVASGPVNVPIVNELGQVVSVRHFDSQEQAIEYFREQEQSADKAPAGNIVPVSLQTVPAKF